MKLKTEIGIICVTAVAIAHLVINGDGSALTAAISAIAALAGISVGVEVAKSKT